jgi:replicative DNA helicase
LLAIRDIRPKTVNATEDFAMTIQTEQLPSRNADAERCLLGSILIDNGALDQVIDRLEARHFQDDSNRRIYAACCRLADGGQRIDAQSLSEELKRRGEYDGIGGGAYLIKLVEGVPSGVLAGQYAAIVRSN